MKIKYLADEKSCIPKVVNWLYEEWGGNYEYGREVWKKRVNNRLNKGKIPVTFVALMESDVVGTASLIKHDMDIKKNLTPWLADVYVPPNYRGKKIATKLVKRVLAEANQINISKVYLYTRQAAGFYRKLNWETIGKCNYYGAEVTLMEFNLN
ncbi:GNAT family N-acetyltransferase [Halanaerobium sp. MA284_MarDTE_T2]|uniref:GNAT family N-acetyltransferase n=1 Tax=Halanaerobium sp. MA284_MarDTE_T2 TaxID=2183913 RepID=UPI000DF27A87|nr:GNAT family N-acetyltransferase [Halanaerobium sp. MA284_MarDTE_T2]RCW41717.1 acetyltransferase (GNAT) family protein [Halanaerobium sp. MA284_MarDTE_T2]